MGGYPMGRYPIRLGCTLHFCGLESLISLEKGIRRESWEEVLEG